MVVLLSGSWIAAQLNARLTIEWAAKNLPDVPAYQAERPAEVPALAPITAISLPAGAKQDDLYRRAAADLAGAISRRTGRRPAILEGPAVPPGRVIVVGRERRPSRLAAGPPPLEAEAFTIQGFRQQDRQGVVIRGGSRLGEVYGLYRLAADLEAGLAEPELETMDRTTAPALPVRLVDLGAVGIAPDPAAWRGNDYSHHSRAFQEVILPQAPYIDEPAFDRVEAEFKAYVHRMISYGYNGIIVNGFLEYINFDRVGSGREIYGPDSKYRTRHQVLSRKFGRLFEYAHDMGLTVILKTDMVALTPPLEAYFESRFGRVDAARPELWAVYGQGLEELFDVFPYVDGLMIRVGEAGAVYNLEGWNYYSALHVTTAEAIQTMLRELLSVAEKRDKKIYFRTWSVGVGEVGNMHTRSRTYHRVLGDIHASSLTVSTKYSMGDFFSYLPLNPTLATGTQPRLIEFQARREFEAFNAFPNYTAPLYQTALQELCRRNPHLEGVWLWTQDGGPVRAGPMSLYPFHGFWLFIDANVYTTGRLAWEPEADLNRLTQAWIRQNLSHDPASVHNLAQMMFLSREAVLQGLYIDPFAQKQALVLGLEPPPTPWFWDIVSGSSLALSAVYTASRADIEGTVAEGFAAVDTVRRMQELAGRVDRSTIHSPPLYDKLLESLAYEENLFQTLAWYRQAFLYFYHWLETGDSQAWSTWSEAYDRFESIKQEHLTRYGQNLDFPAYNFVEVEAALAQAQRSRAMAWLARGILILTLGYFLSSMGMRGMGMPRLLARSPPSFGRQSGRRGWGMRARASFPASLLPAGLIAAGLLTFSSFLAPYFTLWTGLSLLVFSLALNYGQPGWPRSNVSGHIWPLTGPLLGLNSLFMAVVAVRGPLYFWYLFWTSPGFRSGLVILLLGWLAWLLGTIYTTLGAASPTSFRLAGGRLLAALGVVGLLNGLLAAGVGLETLLTTLNNELVLLPFGLSMVLGIATHLNLSPYLPYYIAAGSSGLLALGGLLVRLSE